VSGDNAISLMVQKFYDQMVQKNRLGSQQFPLKKSPLKFDKNLPAGSDDTSGKVFVCYDTL
jgi:truncated hemoglobin YjbI